MEEAADRAGPVAGQVMQAHGRALQVFLQGVQGEGAVQAAQSAAVVGAFLVEAGHGNEAAHGQPPEALAFAGDPVLNFRRIVQGYFGQEVAPVQVERRGQLVHAGCRARPAGRHTRFERQGCFKAANVDHHSGCEAHGFTVHEQIVRECLAQAVQGRAQHLLGGRSGRIGPEERQQVFARQAPAVCSHIIQ